MAFDHTLFGTMLADICGVYEQEEKEDAIASTGYLARYDKIVAESEGLHSHAILAQMKKTREARAAVRAQRCRADLEPLMLSSCS